jgi:hypothetical protein
MVAELHMARELVSPYNPRCIAEQSIDIRYDLVLPKLVELLESSFPPPPFTTR